MRAFSNHLRFYLRISLRISPRAKNVELTLVKRYHLRSARGARLRHFVPRSAFLASLAKTRAVATPFTLCHVGSPSLTRKKRTVSCRKLRESSRNFLTTFQELSTNFLERKFVTDFSTTKKRRAFFTPFSPPSSEKTVCEKKVLLPFVVRCGECSANVLENGDKILRNFSEYSAGVNVKGVTLISTKGRNTSSL